MRVDRTVCALPVRRGQLRRSGCSISVIAGHRSKLLSRRDVSRKSSVRVLVASTLEAPETENRRKTTSENVIVTETRVRVLISSLPWRSGRRPRSIGAVAASSSACDAPDLERHALCQRRWWPQRDTFELAEFKCAISLRANDVTVHPVTADCSGAIPESYCGRGGWI